MKCVLVLGALLCAAYALPLGDVFASADEISAAYAYDAYADDEQALKAGAEDDAYAQDNDAYALKAAGEAVEMQADEAREGRQRGEPEAQPRSKRNRFGPRSSRHQQRPDSEGRWSSPGPQGRPRTH